MVSLFSIGLNFIIYGLWREVLTWKVSYSFRDFCSDGRYYNDQTNERYNRDIVLIADDKVVWFFPWRSYF